MKINEDFFDNDTLETDDIDNLSDTMNNLDSDKENSTNPLDYQFNLEFIFYGTKDKYSNNIQKVTERLNKLFDYCSDCFESHFITIEYFCYLEVYYNLSDKLNIRQFVNFVKSLYKIYSSSLFDFIFSLKFKSHLSICFFNLEKDYNEENYDPDIFIYTYMRFSHLEKLYDKNVNLKKVIKRIITHEKDFNSEDRDYLKSCRNFVYYNEDFNDYFVYPLYRDQIDESKQILPSVYTIIRKECFDNKAAKFVGTSIDEIRKSKAFEHIIYRAYGYVYKTVWYEKIVPLTLDLDGKREDINGFLVDVIVEPEKETEEDDD